MDALAARFEVFGPAAETLRLRRLPIAAPASSECVVEMRFAPVNPADLNTIEGAYAVRPALPATPGIEGSGVVLETGSAVTRVKPGDRVICYTKETWCSHCVVPESALFALPEACDLIQGAMLKVNPTTAWLMLHDFASLEPGEPVLQNAANSGVGRCVIQLARELGLKTINVLRRAELFGELEALGADHCMLDDDSVRASVRDRWQTDLPRLGFNAVGGESAIRLAANLAPSGCLLTYGAMSQEAPQVPNAFLIFRDLRFVGFWLYRWLNNTPVEARDALLARLARLMTEGKLTQPVETVVPLSEVAYAIERARESGRSGKIMLDLQA